MAKMLYKLGIAAYDHRKKFIAAWLAILAVIAGLMATFMGTLSNNFSLPGTETQRVLTILHNNIPELSGGTGTAVFQTADGSAFTAEQQAAIEDAIQALDSQKPVRSALNPFEMQQQIDDASIQMSDGEAEIAANEKKLADGEAQLADGEQQLADAQKKIADGEAEIAANEQKLIDGKAQLDASLPQLDSAKDQLDGAKAQLDAGEKELAVGKQKLADGEAQYAAGQKQIADGEAQLAAGKQELAQKRQEYNAGKAAYDDGVAQLTSQLGVTTLDQVPQAISTAQQRAAAGLKQAQEGLDAANAGVAQAQAGIQQADQTIADLNAQRELLIAQQKQLEDAGRQDDPGYAATYQQLVAKIKAIDVGIEKAQQGKQTAEAGLAQAQARAQQAQAGIDDALAVQAKLAQAQAGYEQLAVQTAALEAAPAQLDTAEQLIAQKSAELEAGKQQLAAKLPELEAGRKQVADGQSQLDSAKAQYYAGLKQYQDGYLQYQLGADQLADGAAQLEAGKQQLAAGKQAIEDNIAKLDDAKAQLRDGSKQLEDGKAQLATGKRLAALTSNMRFVSEDRSTAISQIVLYGQTYALTSEQRADLESIKPALEKAGVNTYYSTDLKQDLNSVVGITEALGFVLAGVVLLVMLGSVVAAGLPLLIALFGVALGVGSTLALSSVIEMQSITPVLALMLGLAVGIDYSLFIVHRHRTQLIAGMDMRESVGRAIGTSGTAVFFAGSTVVIALAALVVSKLPFLAVLGLSAAFTVLMAVLLSISLTPALLAVIGKRVLTKKQRAKRDAAIANNALGGATSVTAVAGARKSPSLWWANTVTAKPWLTALIAIVVLGTFAGPAIQMQTALPDGATEPYGSEQQQAYQITSEDFGPGYNGQILSLVHIPEGDRTEAGSQDVMISVGEMLASVDGVESAVPAAYSTNYEYGVMQLIPRTGPAQTATKDLIMKIREEIPTIQDAVGAGTEINITGQSAAMIDISQRISEVLPPYLTIVVGLSLVLLLLVFRSLVVPLIASLGFLLSLAAAFGSATAVYQWGWLGPIFDVHVPAPLMSFLPILLTGILFGLAMDYQVFVVSSIREAYSHGTPARKAVKDGFNLAAPVVVAAALIMISVFAAFIFAKLTMIRSLGFALAAGVAFDAFIVRMTLTPALLYMLGDKAWYVPKWLDKLLPHVDVEGAKL